MDRPIDDIVQAVEWLGAIGAEPRGGVTRLLYSPAWKEAQQALKAWMEDVGLTTYYDSIGNLFGRLPSHDIGAQAVLVGSHVDTVKHGGKLDGAYGILAGILALKYLKENYGSPKRHIEIVSLCEEEGSRFPIACWGSGMMTGVYSFQNIQGLKDQDGTEFRQAMKDAGFDPAEPFYEVRRDIEAFVELHIEQGQVLETLQKPIGIVEAIVGQKRYRVTVRGESNHAGTTPMKWRKDPVHGTATMIHELLSFVDDYDDHLVLTVGHILVEPNIPNVIASQVTFTVDVRHPDENLLSDVCKRFAERFVQIAGIKGLTVDLEPWYEVLPAKMDAKLTGMLMDICKVRGIPYHLMNSGAGHDSQLFADYCPTALLFVPSSGGISHSLLEHTSPEQLGIGLEVLIQFLHDMAY